jgi:hypothetical protein
MDTSAGGCRDSASLLVLLAGGWGLLAVSAIVAAGILALKEKPARENNVRRSDFEKTGLKQPDQWETGQVADLLEMLVSDLALAEKAEENSARLQSAGSSLPGRRKSWPDSGRKPAACLKGLRPCPGFPGKSSRSYDGLYWFLVNVVRWQECHTELLSCMAAHDEITLQHKKTLAKFNELVVKYTSGTAGDAAGARALLEKLLQDVSTWKECTDEIARLNDRVLEKRKQIERAGKKQEEIYGKLGIDNGRKDQVQELTSLLEEYKNIRQQLLVSEAVCSDKHTLMTGHSLYGEENGRALALAPDEIDDRISTFDEEAQKRDEIQKTITEIETEVKNVKQGHDLEDALREKERAGEELRALFERNLSSVTGQLIADHLKKETREQNRPRVFKRANELFNRITRGALRAAAGRKRRCGFQGLRYGIETWPGTRGAVDRHPDPACDGGTPGLYRNPGVSRASADTGRRAAGQLRRHQGRGHNRSPCGDKQGRPPGLLFYSPGRRGCQMEVIS